MLRDPKQAARVDAQKYKQPTYILWLLRERVVTDWKGLCEHLGLKPTGTGSSILREVLASLERAGLIELPTKGFFRFFRIEPTQLLRTKSLPIGITELAARVLGALEISLVELAEHDPRKSMRVSPVFGLPHGKKYVRDVFVLMPFAAELKPVYEDHIKPVCESLSMTVARADDFFTHKSIIEEIWSAIAQSHILIADCTGRNPNVFYEIGMAHSIGKPVVLITQEADDVPFDLRHRRYLQYKYTPPGMKQFEKALEETLRNTKAEIEALRLT